MKKIGLILTALGVLLVGAGVGNTAAAYPPDTAPPTIPGGGAPVPTTVPPITVPPTIPAGGLPGTGSSGISTTATSALVLLGAGALLLIVSQVRRRRRPASAA